MNEGTITGFSGSYGSGLGYLYIDGIPIPCDKGATVRALCACFGDDVIGEAHTVNIDAITGKRVHYETNGFGLLEWFAPVEDTEEDAVQRAVREAEEEGTDPYLAGMMAHAPDNENKEVD